MNALSRNGLELRLFGEFIKLAADNLLSNRMIKLEARERLLRFLDQIPAGNPPVTGGQRPLPARYGCLNGVRGSLLMRVSASGPSAPSASAAATAAASKY